jgi:hypothetical protein
MVEPKTSGSSAAGKSSGAARMRMLPPLVEANISLNGHIFSARVRKGATANEIVEKVVRKNGGLVEKKYYPEFKAHEITGIRIGDIRLGKRGLHFHSIESCRSLV